jgi:hypothetical protein
MSAKIGATQLDERMWRLTKHQNSVAAGRHPASGQREIPGIGAEFHRRFAGNQSAKHAAVHQAIEGSSRDEIGSNAKNKNQKRNNAPFQWDHHQGRLLISLRTIRMSEP